MPTWRSGGTLRVASQRASAAPSACRTVRQSSPCSAATCITGMLAASRARCCCRRRVCRWYGSAQATISTGFERHRLHLTRIRLASNSTQRPAQGRSRQRRAGNFSCAACRQIVPHPLHRGAHRRSVRSTSRVPGICSYPAGGSNRLPCLSSKKTSFTFHPRNPRISARIAVRWLMSFSSFVVARREPPHRGGVHGPALLLAPRRQDRRRARRAARGHPLLPESRDPAGGTLCHIDRALAVPPRAAKGKRARGVARRRRERGGPAPASGGPT